MSTETGKQVVRRLIEEVWAAGNLDALDRFWTADCVNHAAPPGLQLGLDALRSYHEAFAASFQAFSDPRIAISQQVEQDDRVVTQLVTTARHVAEFGGVPASGKTATLQTIRIDRLVNGKIAEHWSIADIAAMLQQLRS